MRSSKSDVEEEVKNVESGRVPLTKIILSVLEVAGLLAVVVVAPNVIQLFDINGRARRYPRKQFSTALKRLGHKGYIKSSSDHTSWKYELTKEGRELLEKKKINDITITPPTILDGKWRMVVFDIPEKYRHARNALRQTLQRLGFHYVNLSVWVHPFPCRHEISAFVEHYGIGEYVRYVTAESFDDAEAFKPKFGELLERMSARQTLMASK